MATTTGKTYTVKASPFREPAFEAACPRTLLKALGYDFNIMYSGTVTITVAVTGVPHTFNKLVTTSPEEFWAKLLVRLLAYQEPI